MLGLDVCTDCRRLQRIGTLTGAGRDERRTLLSEGGIRTSLARHSRRLHFPPRR